MSDKRRFVEFELSWQRRRRRAREWIAPLGPFVLARALSSSLQQKKLSPLSGSSVKFRQPSDQQVSLHRLVAIIFFQIARFRRKNESSSRRSKVVITENCFSPVKCRTKRAHKSCWTFRLCNTRARMESTVLMASLTTPTTSTSSSKLICRGNCAIPIVGTFPSPHFPLINYHISHCSEQIHVEKKGNEDN